MSNDFDCLVIGAGVIGLAHALAAGRHGLRIAVIDRDARAVGASVRNFGVVMVTGQPAGITWRRARRSRNVWQQLAKSAGSPVLQHGALVCARREEAMAVLAWRREVTVPLLWRREAMQLYQVCQLWWPGTQC